MLLLLLLLMFVAVVVVVGGGVVVVVAAAAGVVVVVVVVFSSSYIIQNRTFLLLLVCLRFPDSSNIPYLGVFWGLIRIHISPNLLVNSSPVGPRSQVGGRVSTATAGRKLQG